MVKSPMTRLLTSLGLLLITCLPGILFVFLQIQQFYIRHKVDVMIQKNIPLDKAARTNQHGYQEIEIARSALVWYEEGREIVVEGTMFDVISIRDEGGILFITGVFDYEETEVLGKVGKLNKQSRKDQEGSLSAQFMAFIYYHEKLPTFNLFSPAIPLRHNPHWVFHRTNPIQEIHCPPPKLMVA